MACVRGIASPGTAALTHGLTCKPTQCWARATGFVGARRATVIRQDRNRKLDWRIWPRQGKQGRLNALSSVPGFDSRSSARVDQVALVMKKLAPIDQPGRRVATALLAENLALTQTVVTALSTSVGSGRIGRDYPCRAPDV
jgi:hypothetical protein